MPRLRLASRTASDIATGLAQQVKGVVSALVVIHDNGMLDIGVAGPMPASQPLLDMLNLLEDHVGQTRPELKSRKTVRVGGVEVNSGPVGEN